MEKGKGQMYEPSGSGTTIGSRVHEGDDRWGPMRSPSPFSGREERSNGRGCKVAIPFQLAPNLIHPSLDEFHHQDRAKYDI
ncbi:hypothetical protein F2Q68_00006914 [Brassica cretica]|uniref:Uncharacterized protein n=1 Tax=Brassica cretica TaxID=69181 RepID=A0A8S9JP04_BRACR|nr:hypothetical protein F2Q68_00006914 [Brassica cretica]